MSINKVTLVGNLTREPELRSTAAGMQVLQFGIAVNNRCKNGEGEWVDVPNYFDCTMFGNRAESISRYLGKGTKVAIAGKLHWSQWEKDGQKRSKVDITVDEIDLMSKGDSKPSQAAQPQQPQGYAPQQQYAPQEPSQQVYEPTLYDEDIPF